MSSLPITTLELVPHLSKLWQRVRVGTNQNSVPKIGLCVSGGPDSMSMAYLIKKIQQEQLLPPLSLTAFIVDHKARIGSTEEACAVSKSLQRLGIRSQILTIKWPPNTQPSALSDFESQARIKRYRLLAHASIQAGIRDLVTGHHEDDQIETILMRLLRTQNVSFSALQGMTDRSAIPCCGDIYGGRDSDPLKSNAISLHGIDATSLTDSIRFEGLITMFSPAQVNTMEGKIQFCSEGINIHRPFLEFPKNRMLATCQANDVEFVDDKTNVDPRVTQRNAVRFLRSYHKVPRALEGSSIVALRSKSRSKLEALRQKGTALLKATKVLRFDLRSGTITACLPKSAEERSQQDEMAFGYALSQLTQAVSPTPRDDAMVASIKGLYRRFSQFNQITDSQPRSDKDLPTVFTADGVLVKAKRESTKRTKSGTVVEFSRQPLRLREMKSSKRVFSPGTQPGQSEWLIWDNRYWIRVLCDSDEDIASIIVRPYAEPDSSDVYHRLRGHSKRLLLDFETLIGDTAPGKTRYTLPVLADKQGICAFPTLDMAIPRMYKFSSDENTMKLRGWEVRYKSLSDDVAPFLAGTQRAHANPSTYSDVSLSNTAEVSTGQAQSLLKDNWHGL